MSRIPSRSKQNAHELPGRPARFRCFATVAAWLVVAAFAGVLTRPANAATFATMDLDALADAASRVVHGVVVDTRTHFAGNGVPRILTDVTVEVAEDFASPAVRAGNDTTRLVSFSTLGGVIGDRAQYVPGLPTYRLGDEVVLFLGAPVDESPVDALLPGQDLHAIERRPVVGLALGTFFVQRPIDGGPGLILSQPHAHGFAPGTALSTGMPHTLNDLAFALSARMPSHAAQALPESVGPQIPRSAAAPVVDQATAHPTYAWYELADAPGQYIRWYDEEIPVLLDADFTPDADDDDVREAVVRSIATWNAVDCRHPSLLDPVEVTDVPPLRVVDGYDHGTNLVVFQDDDEWAAWHPVTPSNILDMSRVLALTTLYYHPFTGAAESFSLEVNDGPYVFSATGVIGANDIQNMLTHELGHVLGLDHPCRSREICGEATMYFSAPAGEIKKRDLNEADIEGLCGLYGDVWVPEPPPGLMAAAGGGGCTAITGSDHSVARTFPVIAFLGAFLMIAMSTRRTRRTRRARR